MDDRPVYTNGVHANPATSRPSDDVEMSDEGAAPPPVSAELSMAATMATAEQGSPQAYTPRERSGSVDEHDGQPPAKRARKHSDADKASLTHSATPPPASAAVSNAASPPGPPPTTGQSDVSMASATSTATVGPSSTRPRPAPTANGTSHISLNQFKFCQNSLRSLKKLKDAVPFLKPVDAVALNIPHYPTIIKHPMDFSTIERKLNSSNPARLDPNPQNPRYYTVDGFIADVRLIFHNCLVFNGPDHIVTQMGKRIEEVFDRHVKQMPPAVENKPAPPPRKATPPAPLSAAPSAAKKQAPARRSSTSVPVIRRNEPEPLSRPKREIHAPAPKDFPYADAAKKSRKASHMRDDGTADQLRFCSKLLQDLFKKQYYTMAHPFYEPVDWVKLEIPTYPKVVKRPMDMSTMKRKLDNREYSTPKQFYDDFKLMMRNCVAFNPPSTPVHAAGVQLQRVFDDKWRHLPSLQPARISDDSDDDGDSDSESQTRRTIAEMETQIATLQRNVAAMKNSLAKPKKRKERKEREPPPPPPPRPAPKAAKPPPKKKASASVVKKIIPDDDVLTFDQKKDLSETITKLEGAKLERVINIIHEGVPEIRDSTEEIELEIDLLPAAVLTKLYNFVIRPLKQPAVKRNRQGKGTGTGGLKRKSMDEDVEAEKIRQLEERMALFEHSGSGAPAPAPIRPAADSDHSSDSSSGSDSSGSDSE